MTDDATTGANVDRLAMLTAKLERESRMTRYLLLICTAGNLAVTTFAMIKSYEYMPAIMLAYFMEHMPELSMTFRAVENANNMRLQKTAPAATK